MKYIIVSDIFGKTPALALFAQSLSANNDYTIVDPYQNENIHFSNEAQAYQYFSEHVGFEKYYQQLCESLFSMTEPFRLIGFSVGAAICWRYSAENNSCYLMKSDLFYGSQIRNMLTLEPLSPVNLILPQSEAHFSIADLTQTLEIKKHIKIEQTEYLHGFMNVLSKNYHQQAYLHYLHYLSDV